MMKTDKKRQPRQPKVIVARLLNQKMAAEMLGVSTRTLARRTAKGGDLEAIKIPGETNGRKSQAVYSETRILELVGAVEKGKRKCRG